VLTGFGRTGKPFGFQHWDVTPDLITVAKGLTSGYAPMGAVLVHERIAKHFEDKILACGLTSYAHPLGCAAALETLKVYDDDGLYERGADLADVIEQGLRSAQSRIPRKSFVRGLGALWALEVEAPLDRWAVLQRELAVAKLSLHVDGKRGTIIVSPPLCISVSDLAEGLRSLGDAADVAFGVAP
jgi:taurine--2-oxoglutarate transaminase